MIKNKIYNGNSLELIGKQKGIADLIVTDPPYKLTVGGGASGAMQGCFDKSKYNNNGQIVKCDITWKQIMKLCYSSLKENSQAYIMTNNRNMEEALKEARHAGFKLHNILIWDKGTVTPNRFYMNRVEFCLFLYKGKSKYIKNMGLSNIFKVHNKKGNGHPTEKPVELMQQWIEQSSDIGDVILDPFMDIGATTIACVNSNRNFIGIELDETYFDKANKRIKNSQNKKDEDLSELFE